MELVKISYVFFLQGNKRRRKTPLMDSVHNKVKMAELYMTLLQCPKK